MARAKLVYFRVTNRSRVGERWILERTYSQTALAEMGEHLLPFYSEIPNNPWLEYAIGLGTASLSYPS